MKILRLLSMFLACLPMCRAGMIYSNLGSPAGWDPTNGWEVDGGQAGGQQVAVQFAPAATTPLTNVQMAIGIQFTDLAQSPLSVYLAADSGGLPGIVLTNLTPDTAVPPFPPGDLADFVCTTCPVLDAGTPYWLVATIPNLGIDYFNSESGWSWNTSLDFSTGTNLAFNETQISPGWQLGAAGDLRPAFGVNTPEPASMLLVGASLLAAARLLRGRRPLQ